MTLHQFELTREFITLDSLLKLLTIAPSGGIAKMMVIIQNRVGKGLRHMADDLRLCYQVHRSMLDKL